MKQEKAEELLGLYFPCLDEGFVSLVDYMGGDESIVQAARVSYGAGTKSVSSDRALVRYLKRHRHTTPFEMVELKFHVKLPIVVARQLIRHRTASVNEYSGRYSLMPMQFYTLTKEQYCAQSTSNKQGRGEVLPQESYDIYMQRVHALHVLHGLMEDHYKLSLDEGLAKELARVDLPLSMYTEWYWKIDLHNLFHFLSLRSDSHAQWEIRQFSDLIAGITQRVAPDAFEAWLDYAFFAVSFGRKERQILAVMLEHGESPSDVELKTRYDLSQREVAEFRAKLEAPAPKEFNLDLSAAQPPEAFEMRRRL